MVAERRDDNLLQQENQREKEQEQDDGARSNNDIPILDAPHETAAHLLLRPYRQASSRQEQYHALEELNRTIVAEYHQPTSSSQPLYAFNSLHFLLEEVARLCMVEIPTTVDVVFRGGGGGGDDEQEPMAAAVDRVLNACGIVASISACVACLKELSAAATVRLAPSKKKDHENNSNNKASSGGSFQVIATLDTAPKSVQSRVLRTCLSTIRRLLCTTSTPAVREASQSNKDVSGEWFWMPSSSPASSTTWMDRWVGSAILLLPQLISNACHALQVKLPSWAVPTRLYPRLVESGLTRYDYSGASHVADKDDTTDKNVNTVEYISALIRHLVCRRSSDTVVVGLYDYYTSKPFSKGGIDVPTLRLSKLLQAILTNEAPRETATFIRSMLQHHQQQQQKHLEVTTFATSENPVQVVAGVIPDDNNGRCDGLPPFLAELCVPLLESLHSSSSLAMKIQESFVRLMAFSPSSIQPGASPLADRQLCRLTMTLLSAIHSKNKNRNIKYDESDDSSTSSSEDEEEYWVQNGEDNTSRSSPPLRRHVRILLESWSQPTFVQRTDRRLQRHVTLLLRFGLSLLFDPSSNKDNMGSNSTYTSPALEPSFQEDDLTLRILEGVTCRLESTLEDIRHDGMKVAQLLARYLGQELVFEELDVKGCDSDDDAGSAVNTPSTVVNASHQAPTNKQQHMSLPGSHTQNSSGKMETESSKGRRKKEKRIKTKVTKPRVLDPDAEYFSEDYDSTDDDEEDEEEDGIGEDDKPGESKTSDLKHDDDDDSSDSCWEGEDDLVPYDLDDDEEDLRDTPRPLSLTECLTLLRAVETEESAYSQHEAGLQEVSSLVKTRPADLPDLAVPLAVQLLRMENKFNLPDFAKMRHRALCSLTVEEPMLVGQRLIVELFEDSGLSDRLNVLAALNEAAAELCGDKAFEESRIAKEKNRLEVNSASSPNDTMRQQAAAQITKLESQTRWKNSRHKRKPPTTISNTFASIAPSWFYALVGKFMQRKDDTHLWAGSTGSQLLAQLIFTLSTIIESSGSFSLGTGVMAQDLFEFVWPFRTVEVAEIRTSVLIAVGVSFGLLPEEAILNLLLGGAQSPADSLPNALVAMAKNDPDKTCRALATSISNSVRHVVESSLHEPQRIGTTL